MKSDKKQQTIKLKPNKKVLHRPKEKEFETTSMSYFRIIKELEKQNSEQKLSQELKKKEQKPKKSNLTELIYEKNYPINSNGLLMEALWLFQDGAERGGKDEYEFIKIFIARSPAENVINP